MIPEWVTVISVVSGAIFSVYKLLDKIKEVITSNYEQSRLTKENGDSMKVLATEVRDMNNERTKDNKRLEKSERDIKDLRKDTDSSIKSLSSTVDNVVEDIKELKDLIKQSLRKGDNK